MSGMPFRYTIENDLYLLGSYYKIPVVEIAKHLGRTVNSVRIRASRLNISKPRGHNVKTGAAAPVAADDNSIAAGLVLDEMVSRYSWPITEPETPALNAILERRNQCQKKWR